jgi:hypothetical protein
MPLALIQARQRANHPSRSDEERLDQVSFQVHKLNSRVRPARDRRLILGCFSEFGCEIVGRMYCIPRLLKRFPGRYVIAMGWHGREYLYRHLVDEFWEIDEKFMWLRNHVYAFHHHSDNLTAIERSAAKHGIVVPSAGLGRYVVGNFCKTCGKYWNEWRHSSDTCPSCNSSNIIPSIFGSTNAYKDSAIKIPQPKGIIADWAKEVVGENAVAIFARGRKTYGRNLPPEFYVKLIAQLRSQGYNPIWLGEKVSTIPCPVSDVIDFSRDPAARHLENTLALICACKFTIQFWTASSRLAGCMGVPYILFESPEQIYSSGLNPGQEGKRLDLTTFGPRKVVLSHYLNVLNNQDAALLKVDEAIAELNAGNSEDMIGLVEDPEATMVLRDTFYNVVRN